MKAVYYCHQLLWKIVAKPVFVKRLICPAKCNLLKQWNYISGIVLLFLVSHLEASLCMLGLIT